MRFDPTAYGPEVARILGMGEDGERCSPLVCGPCTSQEAHRTLAALRPSDLFASVPDAAAPMAGLWLYFSCFKEAHELINDPKTHEGEFWHAILHRQEPDPANAGYWFRLVGEHPVFPKLAAAAREVLARYRDVDARCAPADCGIGPHGEWNPFAFVDFCERARLQPGSQLEKAAMEIQRAEWQILFDYCARPR